jgi:hypothetical protein
VITSCSNCLYFQPGAHAASKDGICRRYPPSTWQEEGPDAEPVVEDDDGVPMVTLQAVVTYVGWPDVRLQDWCGEHRAFDDVGDPPG